MAKDIFGWSRWSPHVGNAITISTGLPVLSGMLAGWWASHSSFGLSIALVALAAFMMTLWCCIGVIWLVDRAKEKNSLNPIGADCSWGLRLDGAILNRDPGNKECEWQVKAIMRNAKPFPIRLELLDQQVVLNHTTPNVPILAAKFPLILGANEMSVMNFPAYSSDKFPIGERLNGQIKLAIKYGHASGHYTRIMKRHLSCIVVPPSRDPRAPNLFPLGGSTPMTTGPLSQESDDPFAEFPPLPQS